MNGLIGAIGKLFDLLIGLLGGSSLLVMLAVSAEVGTVLLPQLSGVLQKESEEPFQDTTAAPASLTKLITIASARILNIFPDMSLPPSKRLRFTVVLPAFNASDKIYVYHILSILEAKGQIPACHCDS